jgi:hypothetical protein
LITFHKRLNNVWQSSLSSSPLNVGSERRIIQEFEVMERETVLSNTSKPVSTTFFLGIESGYFEAQTILAVESLRQFGGRFANAPVFAIKPRFGPSLTRPTKQRLEALNVQIIDQDLKHPYSWYCYMNKALAAMLAEKYATTEQLIWLDSDTLIVDEPERLWLEPGVDFAISSVDKNVGSSGPGDKNEPYWQELCNFYGIEIDQLPWVLTEVEQEKVRFRLHSGVYAFRRGCGIGQGFLDASEKMIESRIGYSRSLPLPGDDVALAFAIVKLNLNFQMLPRLYNYETTPSSLIYKRDDLSKVKVVHYHYTMTNPEACDWAMNEFKTELPEVYQWLQGRVVLNSKIGGIHRSAMRYLLKNMRRKQQQKVEAAYRILVGA